MILRQFVHDRRGRMPHEEADAYLEFLDTRSTHGYAATSGHHGTRVLLDAESEPSVTEFMLLTLWIRPNPKRRSPAMTSGAPYTIRKTDDLLLEKSERFRHYTVVRAPQSIS